MPDNVNPATLILGQLLQKLEAMPFVPFAIVTSNGKRYDVPHADYVTVTRKLRRITWETDDPFVTAEINPLHIVTLETMKPAA